MDPPPPPHLKKPLPRTELFFSLLQEAFETSLKPLTEDNLPLSFTSNQQETQKAREIFTKARKSLATNFKPKVEALLKESNLDRNFRLLDAVTEFNDKNHKIEYNEDILEIDRLKKSLSDLVAVNESLRAQIEEESRKETETFGKIKSVTEILDHTKVSVKDWVRSEMYDFVKNGQINLTEKIFQ